MMDSIDTFNARVAIVKGKLQELYEPGEAAMWLLTPQARLNYRPPVEFLWHEGGYRQVSAIIQQVLDGAFI